MKKMLLTLCCFISIQSYATTWTVNVDDFQFSPATLNVTVGDVIHFVWVSGTHTTTSVSVPVGANSWNSPIDLSNHTFDVSVTTAGTYSYQCNFHAFLGMTATFTASGALPVTFSTFNIITKNNSPQLSWSTTAEINADYFSIRRSFDGKNFKEVGTLPANGTSSFVKQYSFTDDKLPSSVTYAYYELATIDKDGGVQLSPIKMYKNNLAVPRLIISLSPNPVGSMGHLTLQYNSDSRGIMKATLIDMQGKTILETTLSSEPGINNGHIHLMGLPPGIYTLHFVLNGMSESYRLVKD